MSVKDTFETVGMTNTAGIEAFRDHRPKRDADIVARLRDAGAIIFAKTNTPEGAGDHQTYNAIYGVTRNPWDLGRSAGGSSGGSAVSVATGMSPVEVGSDIGGSIRCPAHFNGVFGHKPSAGIVSLRGHMPPGPGNYLYPDMGVGGPLARTAGDLGLLLDVIAGPNELDRKGKVWRLPPPRQNDLKSFRVALWADTRHYPVEPLYLDAIHAFADDLRRLGVTIDETARPDIDPAESHDIYAATLFGGWGLGLTDEAYAAYAAANAGLGPDDRSWPARIGRASTQPVRSWLQLQERREKLRHRWEAFFANYDILLCPVMTTAAFPHDTSGVDHSAQLHKTVTVGGREIPYLDNLIWPGLITVASLPSTAAPMRRFIGDGLPVGIQMVSGYLDDRTTLRFAELVEEALGGFIPPPEAPLIQPSRSA
jgi:amidase